MSEQAGQPSGEEIAAKVQQRANEQAKSGVDYLIDSLNEHKDLPRKEEFVALLRTLLVDAPAAARQLTPDEETAVAAVLGAVQLAMADRQHGPMLHAVAAGVQVAIRFGRQDLVARLEAEQAEG